MDEVVPKKLGTVFSPPTLILLYKNKKNYKKLSMPIRELSVTSDCSVLAARLQARHKRQLSSVNIIAIEKMIRLIQEIMKGHARSEALNIIKKEYELNPDEDLNQLNDKELKRRKAIMDLNFKKNNISKDHPDFVYDKEVDFSGIKQTSNWDSDSESETSHNKENNNSASNKLDDIQESTDLYPINKRNVLNDKQESFSSTPSKDKDDDSTLSPVHKNVFTSRSLQNSPVKRLKDPFSSPSRKDLLSSLDEDHDSPKSSMTAEDFADEGESQMQTEFLSELTRTLEPPRLSSTSALSSSGVSGKGESVGGKNVDETNTSEVNSKGNIGLGIVSGTKPKSLLDPLPSLSALGGSGIGSKLPPLSQQKALPPLDLSKSKMAPIVNKPQVSLDSHFKSEPGIPSKPQACDDNQSDPAPSDHDGDKDDLSFSDHSDLLPPEVNKATSPAKKLIFGIESDEEIEENVSMADKSADFLVGSADGQNGAKIEDAEKSPRSISVGDINQDEDSDFW
eukprot:TRINITY_DN5338_c0_g1_i2.p1 TRINITY_DN5338_c0_g1~~TRINITY_DN5338_c0_g1_i2.p1  ORF type:complete len:508 (-),score=104.15 TRINITY_DN5338_c0_g1_i2:266-1789(-)